MAKKPIKDYKPSLPTGHVSSVEEALARGMKPITSSKMASEMGKKGGSVKSINKKISARLRSLKAKGLTDENAQRLFEIMAEKEYSSFDILLYLESNKNKTLDYEQRMKMLKAMMEWHKIHHGEKKELDMKVTQMQTLTDDEVNEVMKRL